MNKKFFSIFTSALLLCGTIAMPITKSFDISSEICVTANAKEITSLNNTSNQKTSVTLTTHPKTVTTRYVKADKNTVKVSFATQNNVSGYQIQITSNPKLKGGRFINIKNNKTNLTTIKNLAYQKKYYVRIRAYTSKNGKIYRSKWNKAKAVTTVFKFTSESEANRVILKYCEIIDKAGSKYEIASACFYDINKDNIPELILNKGNGMANTVVNYYSYNPNTKRVYKFSKSSSGGHRNFYYNKQTKKFALCGTYMGSSFITTVSIKNGKISETQKFYQADTEARWNRWQRIFKQYKQVDTFGYYNGKLYGI